MTAKAEENLFTYVELITWIAILLTTSSHSGSNKILWIPVKLFRAFLKQNKLLAFKRLTKNNTLVFLYVLHTFTKHDILNPINNRKPFWELIWIKLVYILTTLPISEYRSATTIQIILTYTTRLLSECSNNYWKIYLT